jgi:hypothetical protein
MATNTTIYNNLTIEEFSFTLIRNVKQNDQFVFERNAKATVIQDSRNPSNFLYLTECDR